MSHDDIPYGPELSLALLQRNGLARSLHLRGCRRAHPTDLTRSLRALSQLDAALVRRRPAQGADQIPRFLLDATRRVREGAAAGEPLPWQRPDP